MPDEPRPRFTGIFIPVEILTHPDLSLLEKMLLSWIDALYCQNRGGCFASNRYLGDKLGFEPNTIAKCVVHLRKLGLIKDVSKKGDSDRVIVALIGQEMDKKWRTKGDPNPTPIGLQSNPPVTEIQPPMDKNPIPSIKESKVESKDYNLEAANAAGKKFSSLLSFPQEVQETGTAMIEEIVAEKPDYKRPTSWFAIQNSIDQMIRIDKRTPERILAVLRWALSDDFWRPHFMKANPASYLRSKFDQLETKLNKPYTGEKKVDRRTKDRDGKPVEVADPFIYFDDNGRMAK